MRETSPNTFRTIRTGVAIRTNRSEDGLWEYLLRDAGNRRWVAAMRSPHLQQAVEDLTHSARNGGDSLRVATTLAALSRLLMVQRTSRALRDVAPEPLVEEASLPNEDLPAGLDQDSWNDLGRNYRDCFVGYQRDGQSMVGTIREATRRGGRYMLHIAPLGEAGIDLVPYADIQLRPHTFGLVNTGRRAVDVSFSQIRSWRRGINTNNVVVRDAYRNSLLSINSVVASVFSSEYLSFDASLDKVLNHGHTGSAFSNQLCVVTNHLEGGEGCPIIKNRLRYIGIYKKDRVIIPEFNKEFVQMVSDHCGVEVVA